MGKSYSVILQPCRAKILFADAFCFAVGLLWSVVAIAEPPLLQEQTKRQDSAMFALESRFWLVPCAALMC